MDQNALVNEEINAGAEFVGVLDKRLPVKAAFWLKAAASSRWYLYIASERVDDLGTYECYGEVTEVARENPDPYLDPFRVKLIPTTDPLARDAIAFCQRFPGRSFARYRDDSFGGESVEGLYIYPIAAPTPAE